MRSILVVAMVMTACDAGAPTCKDAVTKLRTADEAMSFETAAKLVGRCELEGWTVAARKCVAGAKSHHDVDVCLTKLMPEEHDRYRDSLAIMRRFKDEMCQCTSTTCAQQVSDEMTKWAQEQAKDVDEPPKLNDQEMKEAAEIGEQMGKCMQQAMIPDVPRQMTPEPDPPAKAERPL